MKRLAGQEVSLKEFFDILNIYFYNCRVLHWKIKSNKFEKTHELMNDYYNKFSDDIDLVAEMLLSNNLKVSNLDEIINNIENNIDVELIDANKDYTYDEVIDYIDDMFAYIIKYIKRLLNEDSVVTSNPGITSELENLYSFYDKELNYKNKRRKED